MSVTRLADGSLRLSGAPVTRDAVVSATVKATADGDLVTVRSGGRVLATETVAANTGRAWAIWTFGASKINGRSIF